MGKGSQRITTSGDSENNGLGSCEAHHVSISPEEDCSISEGEVGEAEGGAAEEGCLEPAIMPEWVVPHLGRGKAVGSSR